MKERKSDHGQTLIAKLYASGKCILNIAKERNCKQRFYIQFDVQIKKHTKEVINIQEFREYCSHNTFLKNEFQTTKMSGETSLT